MFISRTRWSCSISLQFQPDRTNDIIYEAQYLWYIYLFCGLCHIFSQATILLVWSTSSVCLWLCAFQKVLCHITFMVFPSVVLRRVLLRRLPEQYVCSLFPTIELCEHFTCKLQFHNMLSLQLHRTFPLIFNLLIKKHASSFQLCWYIFFIKTCAGVAHVTSRVLYCRHRDVHDVTIRHEVLSVKYPLVRVYSFKKPTKQKYMTLKCRTSNIFYRNLQHTSARLQRGTRYSPSTLRQHRIGVLML